MAAVTTMAGMVASGLGIHVRGAPVTMGRVSALERLGQRMEGEIEPLHLRLEKAVNGLGAF